jgi:hypothetical protein
VLAKPFPGILFPFFAIRTLTCTLRESSYLRYIASEGPIQIYTDEKRFHVDGEPVILNGEVNVSISKGSLKVLKTRWTRWI